jgi:hypothetical protein
LRLIAGICIAAFLVMSQTAASGDGAALALSLEADSPVFSFDDADSGELTITARFKNLGGGPVFLAHPSTTVPDGYEPGGTFSMSERHGRSDILLYITRPDGGEVVLRNNALRGFEPGNRFRLDIPPGETREIRLGWLGQFFALGMWDDLREPVFTERGVYKFRMVYRNRFHKAFSFKRDCDVLENDAPWTGELESNAILVRVE